MKVSVGSLKYETLTESEIEERFSFATDNHLSVGACLHCGGWAWVKPSVPTWDKDSPVCPDKIKDLVCPDCGIHYAANRAHWIQTVGLTEWEEWNPNE